MIYVMLVIFFDVALKPNKILFLMEFSEFDGIISAVSCGITARKYMYIW